MKTPRSLLAAFLAVSVLAVAAFAADPSGNWKWTSVSKAGGAAEVTAVLAVKEGKLTGTVTGRQGPADIADATLAGDQISFTVVRTSGNVIVTFKYSGQVSANTIKGTLEKTTSADANPTKTDWTATRAP